MAARTRVLVLIKGLGVGGAEKLLSEGSRYWDRDRYDYHVAYALPWKNQLVPEFESHGIEVHLIGSDRGLTLGTVGRLRGLINDLDIDFVHAHSPTLAVVSRLFAGVPTVYTEHNMSHSYRPATRLANRATYWRNAALIAVSEAVANSVRGWSGPEPVVVPNGVSCHVDESDIRAAREELGLEPGSSLVVHVGNIRPGKGHDTLIDAVKVFSDGNQDVRWLSIGGEKYEGDLDRVRTRAEEERVSGRLRFTGRRPDALSFVGAADVFVNPADVEGLPVAVLEAMALARPVVATAVGGVPSVVKDGETGILVQPGDPEALAAGVRALLSDRELATRLGKEGQALVEREFGLESMVRSVEDIYQAVLQ